jgi:hypothetical protein
MRAVWSHGTVCHPTVLCCVKTLNVVVTLSVSNIEAWKPLCVLVFLLCNAHLLSLCLAFSSALVPQPLLFGLMVWQLPCCVFSDFEGVTCLGSYWPQNLASPKMGVCLCFLQRPFRILPCAVNHISFADIGEERPTTT